MPPKFYISQDDDRALVQRLEELNPQEDKEDLQYSINMIRSLQGNTRGPQGKSILVSSRKKQINNIILHLKSCPVVKKVQFHDKVTCLKLISLTEIYHCLYPRSIPLKDKFDPPIRKLENNVYCI